MDAQEVAGEIKDRIVPRLQELGIDACVISGYRTDAAGVVSKFTVGFDGNNSAYADGLRPLLQAAGYWGGGKL